MQFQDELAGGIVLVRPALRSPDYVAGSTGWSIDIDGSAEFNNIVAHGDEVIVGPATGPQVEILVVSGGSVIRFPINSTNFTESSPASIGAAEVAWGASDFYAVLDMSSPEIASPSDQTASISLESESTDSTRGAQIRFWIANGSSDTIATFSKAQADFDVDVSVSGGSLTASNMAWGSAQAPAPGGSPAQTSVNVTFATALPNTPRVVVTADTASSDLNSSNIRWATTGESTTGFTINCWRDTDFATNFNWIAVSD